MKRAIALCLSIVMALCMMPVHALASDQSTAKRTELISLACEVFPEYSEVIRGEKNTTFGLTRFSNSNEIIVCETRSVSENQEITYTEFSDGTAIVASNEYEYSSTISDRESSGSATHTVINIEVTCNKAMAYSLFQE